MKTNTAYKYVCPVLSWAAGAVFFETLKRLPWYKGFLQHFTDITMLYNPFVKLLKYKIWKENLYIDSETKIDYAETCRSNILKNDN